MTWASIKWASIKAKFSYWWAEGYLSWDGIAVAISCLSIGVLYHFGCIDRFMLLTMSSLLVIAAELVGYRTSKAHGRIFDAAVCLICAILYLLLLW